MRNGQSDVTAFSLAANRLYPWAEIRQRGYGVDDVKHSQMFEPASSTDGRGYMIARRHHHHLTTSDKMQAVGA